MATTTDAAAAGKDPLTPMESVTPDPATPPAPFMPHELTSQTRQL